MTTVTVQTLQMLRWKSRKGRGKPWGDVGKHTWRVCDMLGQTVTSMGSSNREGLIAEGGQPWRRNSATVRKLIEDVSGPQNRPCTGALEATC